MLNGSRYALANARDLLSEFSEPMKSVREWVTKSPAQRAHQFATQGPLMLGGAIWLVVVVLPAFLMAARPSHSVTRASQLHAISSYLGNHAQPYLGSCPIPLLAYTILCVRFAPLSAMFIGTAAGRFTAFTRVRAVAISSGAAVLAWILFAASGAALVMFYMLLLNHAPWLLVSTWTFALVPLLIAAGMPALGLVLLVTSIVRRKWWRAASAVASVAVLGLLGGVDRVYLNWSMTPAALERVLFTGQPELTRSAVAKELAWFVLSFAIALVLGWLRQRKVEAHIPAVDEPNGGDSTGRPATSGQGC